MALLEVSHIEKNFENTKVLKDISFQMEEGQAVSMELLWDNAAEKNYTGVITGISHMNEDPKEGSDKKLYKAYASFEADERIRLGMTMLIYPVDNTEKTEEPEE